MITLDELVREIEARLDERLAAEEPLPYGDGIAVRRVDTEHVLVTQPGGPDFLVFAMLVSPATRDSLLEKIAEDAGVDAEQLRAEMRP